MRKLLGRVDEKNNFYNFYPLFEIEHGDLKRLSRNEIDYLLGGSAYPNINLSYKMSDASEITGYLCDSLFQILELEPADMELNLKPNGMVNQTKFKIDALKYLNEGKLYDIDKAGYYRVVASDDYKNDFRETDVIEIDASIITQQYVLLEVEDEDIYLGPYEVKYRQYDGKHIVTTQLKENKYTLSGYDKSNCRFYTADLGYEYDNKTVLIVKPTDPKQKKYIDVITEDKLFDVLKEAVSSDLIVDGKLDLSDIEVIKKQFEESMLIGEPIDTHIRNNRLQRITEKLQAADDLDDALKFISETLGNSFFTLMEKYQGEEDVQNFVNKLLEFKPDFLDNIKSIRPIQERIDSLLLEQKQLSEQIVESQDELENIQKNIESIEQRALDKKGEELSDFAMQKNELSEELESLYKQLECVRNTQELQKKADELEESIRFLTWREDQLKVGNNELETRLASKIDEYNHKMYEVALDGFIANKMMEASAEWDAKNTSNEYDALIEAQKNIPVVEMSPQELVDYLYSVIRIARPSYEKNTIINFAICLTQGFLTVLSGKPGCGKTSICNLFAKALGLDKIREYVPSLQDGMNLARFIPISVERGWTSKRDLIGYYNPLTKSFDKSNKQIYDALQILTREKQNNCSKFPYLVLLDEANLSPMEYYWADFMNICDDLNENSTVNLGGDNIFKIPNTLHFMATINNDHTTETLSPRLIDRAWVVTLPKSKFNKKNQLIPEEMIRIVPWDSMRKAFMYDEAEDLTMPNDMKSVYEKISAHYEKAQMFISPRVEMAISRYCSTATKLFEPDSTGRDTTMIALDFAVSQKLLPKIAGYGDEFHEWLDNLAKVCSNNALYQSETILREIIARGDQQMKYYQFF